MPHDTRNRRLEFRSSFFLAALLATTASATAAGETVTVTTLEDVVDVAASAQVGSLPGPDGVVSFREAVAAVNATPGAQTIVFAIPQSEFWLQTNVALLRLEFGAFVLTDDATTIDFSTQTANVGDTNPNGPEVGFYGLEPNGWGGAAIYVNGDNCVFRGLGAVFQRGYAIALGGNANRVVGCQISGPLYAAVYVNGGFNGPPATGNVIGGTAPGDGNVLSGGNCGVRIDGPATGNVVIGNTLSGPFWGVEVRSPTCCPGNEAVDNRIGGPTPAERNVIAGSGKYGEEGFPVGGQVTVQYSTGTIVEGNYIGVLADGQTVPASQRGPVGVEVRSSPGTIVRDNVISGIRVVGSNHYAGQVFGIAVNVMGDSGGTVLAGNLVGVGADGATPTSPPNRAGVVASYWSVDGMPVVPGPVRIGGQAPGEGNVIAHSELAGVRVDSQHKQVRVSGNSIDANGGLGIDLSAVVGGAGVTPNDPGDADEGGNRLQNFPTLLTADLVGNQVHVVGTIETSPASTLTIELFASPACDPSGFGEGRQFLGTTTVVTDGAGNAAFDVTLPVAVAPGSSVTATATLEPSGATSEFSACVPVAGSAGNTGLAFCFGDGTESVPCPCGNPGLPGRGCDNSEATGGASLVAVGTASLSADSLVLSSAHQRASGTTVVLQGDSRLVAATSFGQGLRCFGGGLERLYVKNAVGGGVSAPQAGDASVSARSAALGDPIGAGTRRQYMTYYRDPVVVGGCPSSSTFNGSHALDVLWAP